MASEERKNAAADTITRCEQMYRQTRNPYFILEALSASRWGQFTPPDWALGPLLDVVNKAVRKHESTGERISIDAALGLALSRGKKRSEQRAFQHSIESSAFGLIETIHACFVVSIPCACEIVYYAIDFNFVRSWDEVLWKPTDPNPKLGITREHWAKMDSSSRAESRQWITVLADPDAVKEKMRNGRLREITYGDRLGYGLEQLIDKYHRTASKRRASLPKLEIELPPYAWDDEAFATELTKARELIDSGKRTSEGLIKLISSKGALTEAQKAQIRGQTLKPNDDAAFRIKNRAFYEGAHLLVQPEGCTHKLKRSNNGAEYEFCSISAVARLERRPEFSRFIALVPYFSRTVPK